MGDITMKKNRPRLFGTDGIRAVANRYPMTPEFVLEAGRTICRIMGKGRADTRIVVGKDTRLSGDMLVSALAAGICSMGGDVLTAGVIPTPGVAYLTRALNADAGIMVSASHNPYEDNGIKIFDCHGFKISDEMESAIENGLAGFEKNGPYAEKDGIGTISQLTDALDRYIQFLIKDLASDFLKGVNLVIDCANGAASKIAPLLFSRLGANLTVLFDEPDGKNINDNCGSEYTETLAQKVIETKADMGLAFDGDADRIIAVDEEGRRITGDQVLAVCAKHLNDRGMLKNRLVVSTKMSNIGLKKALAREGISHLTVDVGDRRVLAAMIENNAILGGEDSGHVIFLDRHTTGDGILTGLRLLEAVIESKKPLSAIAKIMTVYPQVLKNIPVSEKKDIFSIPEIANGIAAIQDKLAERGRVLVRYSGTQPLCRVMVEGPDPAETEAFCDEIVALIQRHLG